MTGDPGNLPERVVATLAEGRRIEAIKALREATGLGLKEALDLVDQRLRDDAALQAAYNRAHHDIVSPGIRWAVAFLIIALAIFLFVRRI